MKKISLVAAAVALAIAFSAFTPTRPAIDLFYESSPGVFTEIPPEVTPCPAGEREQCSVEIEGQTKLLWEDPNGLTPYMRD